jgi:hypothetical protein
MFILLALIASSAYAVVGCTLNDPEKDTQRLFPGSTSYTVVFISIKEKGGEPLKKEIERELGDVLEPVYENIDVPYAFYTVFKGKEVVGYVHGVNQKGKYGGMQLMVATDLEGKIRTFWYHRLSSPEAAVFQAVAFTDRFNGLTLKDFMGGNLSIPDPSKNSAYDFHATIRGLKKNLILFKRLFLENEEQVNT